MASVRIEARKRCYNHPHRETDLVCGRCRTAYCADCLGVSGDDGARLCATCAREVEAAEAAKLTFAQRLLVELRSFGRGLAVALALALVLGGIFFAFKDTFDRPLTPEELARFRYAVSGTFETDEGVNLNSTVVGSAVVAATSEAEGYPAKQVINEFTNESIVAWRSADGTLPQSITTEFSQRGAPEKVTLQNHPNEPPDTWPKEFEILISTEGPDSGFVSVGRFTAAQTTELQRFTFPRTVGQWMTLRILSNYGSTEYTSLDEFGAYNVPVDPFGTSRATPTP